MGRLTQNLANALCFHDWSTKTRNIYHVGNERPSGNPITFSPSVPGVSESSRPWCRRQSLEKQARDKSREDGTEVSSLNDYCVFIIFKSAAVCTCWRRIPEAALIDGFFVDVRHLASCASPSAASKKYPAYRGLAVMEATSAARRMNR